MSHLSGIRHYKLFNKNGNNKNSKENSKSSIKSEPAPDRSKMSEEEILKEKQEQIKNLLSKKYYEELKRILKQSNYDKDLQYEEFYMKENFASVTDALELFKDDDLLYAPGIFHR